MKILIRNLDRSTNEETLTKLFSTLGTVQSCTIVMDQETGKSKGFAFIEMPKPGDAKAAIKSLNNSVVDGASIRVKKAQEKSE